VTAELAAEVPTLRGQRCTLRELRPADAVSLQRHADDPAVAYNLFDGFPQPYTLEEAERWCGDLHREPAFAFVFGIVPERERDDVAGCISVTPQAGLWACSAVVGYWLGQAYWRRGISSEALALVTGWAWARMPQVTRLWMPIYARNQGSQRVARRAGYTLEGRMPRAIRKSGEAIDAVTYGCTRPGLLPSETSEPS
jgi:[ribosomal protein S5]-alanine N-acetyltransferase